jgi:hypothetical protein
MRVCANLPLAGRDVRLDLFRGLANWAIFLDHIPHEVLSWITVKNYGFSDAADLFVFISGYTAALVFGRVMIERGYAAAASRLAKRAFELYTAHIIVVVIYIAVIACVSREFHDPDDLNQFNIAVFISKPLWQFSQTLALRYKPVNLDVLPLYILLLGAFAPALWLMVRKPTLTLAGSLVLYFAARHFGWNLPASPSGLWYFNPFAWQLLFFLGAWIALGGAKAIQSIIRTRGGILVGDRLHHRCFRCDDSHSRTRPRRFDSTLDAGAVRSQRQDQSRALPGGAPRCSRCCRHAAPAGGFAYSAMALVGSANPVWPELATSLLPWHRPVILCPCRDRTEPEFALGSNLRGRYRNIAHDRKRILFDVVQTADRAVLAAHLRPLLKLERSEPVANQNADSSKGVRHAIY